MAVTPEQRGPFGRWLVAERRARGWKADELRDRLRDARGFAMGHSTYALLESGLRKPTEEQRRHLTEFLGSQPEGEEPAADLIVALERHTAALERQTEAIGELVAVMREDRGRVSVDAVRVFLSQLRAEGLLEANPGPGTPTTGASRRRRAPHDNDTA